MSLNIYPIIYIKNKIRFVKLFVDAFSKTTGEFFCLKNLLFYIKNSENSSLASLSYLLCVKSTARLFHIFLLPQ